MKWSQPRRRGLLLQSHSRSKQNERLDSNQWNHHKFDKNTGQIYTEKTASILSADDRDWARRTRVVRGPDFRDEGKYAENINDQGTRRIEGIGSYQKSSGVRRLGGARSLQNTALESVIQNISDITPDLIKYLPIRLVKRIWDIVNNRCTVSFDTWATFSKFLREEDGIQPELMRYTQTISSPRLPLMEYTTPLISNTFDFLTSLSITTPFPVPDLVKLSTIRNLGVLEIINTEYMKGTESASDLQLSVGDRLIRAWHLAAANEGAFAGLRILRLWNHEDLTSQSLVYLNGFPSLAVYNVKGCGFDKDSKIQARRLGWKPCLETNILELLEETCAKRKMFMQAQLNAVVTADPQEGSQYILNRTEVRRIPRTQLSAFITSRQCSNPNQTSRKPEVEAEIAPREYNRHHQVNSGTGSWDLAANKAYARIGELRNDTDLRRAGVAIGDQAAVMGNELICSIPMASLRLGQNPTRIGPITATRLSPRAVSFIRIKAPSSDTPQEEENRGSKAQGLAANSFGNVLGSTRAAPVKQPATGMMKNKRRKLDDVLGSFF